MAVPFSFEEVDEIDVIRQQLQAILTLLANRPRTMNQPQHQQSHPSTSSHHARLLNVQPSSSSNTISASENLTRHRPDDHENANNLSFGATMNATNTSDPINNININNTTADGSTNTTRPWRNFRDEITHLAQQLTDDENITNTDNSNNDQTKISITTFFGNTQDWAHLGVTMRRIAEANAATAIIKTEHTTTSAQSRSSNGLLSELIPDDWTTPLWTAMICFVGWHVFRSR